MHALVGSVLLAASVAAQGFHLDYSPNLTEVVLDTDSTLIQPTSGPPVRIVGGVFLFRNVTIADGVTVRAIGSRPMIWIVTGDFVVNGELTASGGNGERGGIGGTAHIPTRGGAGVATGGNGWRGSPSTVGQDANGETGFGLFQVAGAGGRGGLLSDNSLCGRGSGGGGGAFATQGDPWFPVKSVGIAFHQQLGIGGNGCQGASGAASRSLRGGAPGTHYFSDGRDDNDFFGTGADLHRRIVIPGELPALVGGSGGGGGGDGSTMRNPPNWRDDWRGGGGGGGGGALAILALGRIVVGPRGWIHADGGAGGTGEDVGNAFAGGGGGGAGGMVLLYAGSDIRLQAHGETFANGDFAFSVSADGGTGGGALAKYAIPFSAAVYDATPAGGFGGMGIVQMFTRPGTNADGTNTHLDDNVRVFRDTVELTAREKQRYLAWRGFPNAQGVRVDDFGMPTNIGDNEGDIRPTPVLLPILP